MVALAEELFPSLWLLVASLLGTLLSAIEALLSEMPDKSKPAAIKIRILGITALFLDLISRSSLIN